MRDRLSRVRDDANKQMIYFEDYTTFCKRYYDNAYNYIPMDCIWLKDSTGRLMYEGDIIKFEGEWEYGVIEYDSWAYGYRLYYQWVEQFYPYIWEFMRWEEDELDYVPFEVIGNVYTDSYLIE